MTRHPAVALLGALVLAAAIGCSQTDPLPSWNNGKTKIMS